MGAFKHTRRVDSIIPSSSLADMAFLLLIFFMVSTVFRTEKGLRITLPQAEATEKLKKKRNIRHVWIARSGTISIDDNVVTPDYIPLVIAPEVIKNPALVVGLRADKDAPFKSVNAVLEGLKQARAFRVNFASKTKRDDRPFG
jgi:biopolymer transport protein ExbD